HPVEPGFDIAPVEAPVPAYADRRQWIDVAPRVLVDRAAWDRKKSRDVDRGKQRLVKCHGGQLGEGARGFHADLARVAWTSRNWTVNRGAGGCAHGRVASRRSSSSLTNDSRRRARCESFTERQRANSEGPEGASEAPPALRVTG